MYVHLCFQRIPFKWILMELCRAIHQRNIMQAFFLRCGGAKMNFIGIIDFPSAYFYIIFSIGESRKFHSNQFDMNLTWL